MLTLKHALNVIKRHRKPREANWLVEDETGLKVTQELQRLFVPSQWLKSFYAIALPGKVWVFFFLLSFAVFLFSSLSYFLLSVPISTPALLLLSNSRKKSWVLTPPIEFLENGGPPLSWLPWMREEVVQVSQKNGLHYWVPSGRRIPVLSQPAHVPGDWPKTEFAENLFRGAQVPCDVAHSPECILKPLRRAGSRQCDSIPSPLATSRAEPEFSSKSLKTMELLPASEPRLLKFLTHSTAGAAAPQGISLLST